MPQKAVHLLVLEGFADWEPAHAVAELRRQGHYDVDSGRGHLRRDRRGLFDSVFLKGRRHTSNGLAYLRAHVPGISEAGNYVDAPAVRDRKLITASGLADVEFTREMFEELEVLSAEDRSLWAQMFGTAKLPPRAN